MHEEKTDNFKSLVFFLPHLLPKHNFLAGKSPMGGGLKCGLGMMYNPLVVGFFIQIGISHKLVNAREFTVHVTHI